MACRGIAGTTLLGRSACPYCHRQLSWYELIPVVSWVLLRGKCRTCRSTILWLYPFIEIITAFSLLALWYMTPMPYAITYFLFFSALLVTMRTDIEHMLILDTATLYMAPVGVVAACLGLLPITCLQSFIGGVVGYGILWLLKTVHTWLTGKDGMGEGDLLLLMMIGTFLGPLGVWFTLLIGSLIGSLCALILYALGQYQRNLQLPFGAFLVVGAMAYTILQNELFYILRCILCASFNS